MGRGEKPGRTPGDLVIIGGAEDDRGPILEEVVRLGGGDRAVIAVLATASGEPEGAERRYEAAFRKLGVAGVEVLPVRIRQDGEQQDILDRARRATAFFFTGGDQLRITSALGGTSLDSLLRLKHAEGTLVAGTSAGASVMSETMIVEGDSDDAPKKCTIKMAPGMGFLEGAVVDQHFAQRGRLGRLLTALAQNPRVLGLGIDEDTAVCVRPDRTLAVIGSQTVTVVDGRSISHTNASVSLPDEPLALSGVVLHVLPSGYRFDLAGRSPLPPVRT